MKSILLLLQPGIWTLLWISGGWLLAATLFRLRRVETAMVGLGLGLVAQLWLANVLAHALPIMPSFWLASALTCVAGIAAALRYRRELQLGHYLPQWLILGAMTLLFYAIGRGLAIFDDYQNLPTVSLMAAGDVPPHFALNPALRFGYHYLLLLFAAEVMRLGNAFPWSALDLARGLSLALPLVLGGLWAYRITGSRVAATLTGAVMAFAGGARWLLLLLPPAWLQATSANITLIGSAATSAPDLAQAMIAAWKIDGAGPIPFPFAFYSGINQPFVMAYTGIAGSANIIMLLLLLTARRWRHWGAAVLTIVLLASLAIANEIAFLLVGLGLLIALLAKAVSDRRFAVPAQLARWVLLMAVAVIVAAAQGGMLTELITAVVTPRSGTSSYFDTTPTLVWPPAFVSAHLGSLSLVNPGQLVVALLEIGPIVLITPLALAWAWRTLRVGNWYEAALIATSLGALIAAFIAFRGPLLTATPRLMGGWFFICSVYSVPLLWIWLRTRSDRWRLGAAATVLVSCVGGLVLFGIQLAAIQRPVYSTFITPMDAKMSQEYWNKLPGESWIFDSVVFRAPTVFGRFTESSPSWYARSSSWQALNDAPSPTAIHGAGFDYMYFDSDYWEGLTTAQRLLFDAPCVKQIAQVDGVHSTKDYTKDFRRLLDLRSCN